MDAKNNASVLSNDVIQGSIDGQSFSFIDKAPKQEKDGVFVWADESSGIAVRVQRRGPYDGMQDTIWGQVSKGKKSVSLNCYIGNG